MIQYVVFVKAALANYYTVKPIPILNSLFQNNWYASAQKWSYETDPQRWDSGVILDISLFCLHCKQLHQVNQIIVVVDCASCTKCLG